MKIRIASLAVMTLLAGLMVSHSAVAQVTCPQANSTIGTPVVHNQHIFCGEVSSGKGKGFHSRPGGLNPASVANTGTPAAIVGAPTGIYNLRNFNITQGGVTRTKAISTMYPDACAQADVLAAIRNAVATGIRGANGQFTGSSGTHCQAGGAPFNIIGYLDGAGEVITAWPNY